MSITIITYPNIAVQGSYHKIISNFLRIADGLPIVIFSNVNETPESVLNGVKSVHIPYSVGSNSISVAVNFLLMQARISWQILRNRKAIDGPIVIFSGSMVLPFVVSKILRKRTIIPALAPESRGVYYRRGANRSKLISLSESICFNLASLIAIEGPSIVSFMSLERFQSKIYSQGSLFIADTRFDIKVPFNKRGNKIAFIGRFSEEKGISNLLKAISVTNGQGFEIELVGEGDLSRFSDFYEDTVRKNISAIRPWISQDDLPTYLNGIKFLVLPSYTEGLPNIVMEAMSCGVVVIANPVGAVPDVVIDGVTGILMKDNSPDSIRDAIAHAISMDSGTLDRISNNARNLIFNKYSISENKARWLPLMRGDDHQSTITQ
jgi:glycosyltransferase involved in cell wall biosynthesis